MKIIKAFVRELCVRLHIDATQNLKYDRLTKKIIKQCLKENSNTIDIGCHKGEILEMFKHHAPKGKHIGFEPIPALFESLKLKFPSDTIYPYALSKEAGSLSFHHVVDDPAYSGLKKRQYKTENPKIVEFEVEVKTLDSLVEDSAGIDFIKIDVEGAEYDVLQGAQNILRDAKPTLLFEFGLGASEFYNSSPEEMFSLLHQHDYKIYLLDDFTKGKSALSKEQFVSIYQSNKEYYFVAQ